MPKFRMRAVEVTAVQWNGKQDDAAVRALCDHYASLDNSAGLYVTENDGAHYLWPGCWVVDLGDVPGFREKIGRYGVFTGDHFAKLFEASLVGQIVRCVKKDNGCERLAVRWDGRRETAESFFPKRSSWDWLDGRLVVLATTCRNPNVGDWLTRVPTGTAVAEVVTDEQFAERYETAPARSSAQPIPVVDRHGVQFTAVRWDGDSDTANTFLGDRYGADWEYERVGSPAILLGDGPIPDMRPRVEVGHWIVKTDKGFIDSVVTDKVMWDHFSPSSGVYPLYPVSPPPEVSANGGPHTAESVWGEDPAGDEADEDEPTAGPVAGGIDGSWYSMLPPLLLPNGFTERPAPVVEYRIVSRPNRDDMVAEVNGLLAAGWELYGHLVPDAKFFIQPLVRRGVRPTA